jgi:anti-sigma B factor antagonist
MNIEKTVTGKIVTLAFSGRLDTITCSQLTTEIENMEIQSGNEIILDFKNLDYISSAGLGVILTAQKKITALSAKMEIINVNEIVNDIFNITGFSKFLNIKKI